MERTWVGPETSGNIGALLSDNARLKPLRLLNIGRLARRMMP